ncbi:MAG: hypothetical protein LHW56_01775 [Candidatus Cloacimonetes bacterium]|nr:hypothetical protein [Candidatus Cloacimonadota bacterium]MDY0171617.1 hypothetical protein [Candidatus Cloacimonadaceae bacterium]
MKKAAAIAFSKVLEEWVRDRPKHLEYVHLAFLYLTKARSIPVTSLPNLPVGVFAKPEHAKKYIEDPDLHSLYDEYFSTENKSGSKWGSVVTHSNDSPGTIARFKVRPIDPTFIERNAGVPLEELPPHILREAFRKSGIVNIGEDKTSPNGVTGLHRYQRLLGHNETSVYVTEGEFDAFAAMVAQDLTGTMDFIIVSSGGSGTVDLAFLREYGVRHIWLVPDRPGEKRGDEYACRVLNSKANFTQTLDCQPLSLRIFTWPHELLGGDLDDAVQFCGHEVMLNYLFHQRNAYFLNAASWVTEKACSAIEDLQEQYNQALHLLDTTVEGYENRLKNLVAERDKKSYDEAKKWFGLLSDPSECQAYIAAVASRFNVDLSQVSSVNEALASSTTLASCLALIKKQLSNYLRVSYYERKGGRTQYKCWAVHKSELWEFEPKNENALFNLVAASTGRTGMEFFDQILGNNHIYLEGIDEETEPGRMLSIKKRNAWELLKEVAESMLTDAINVEELATLTQGIHYSNIPAEYRRKGDTVYFVNGKKVFRGRFSQDDQLTWEELKSNIDGKVLFENLSPIHRWSFVQETTDLERANTVDLQFHYRAIRTVLDGWKLEHNDMINPFLAAYIMSLPIMASVGESSITFITGQAESGKSSLIHGILGGPNQEVKPGKTLPPSLLESAVTANDATAASLYQTMQKSTLAYVLDEAEETGAIRASKAEERNREIMTLLYRVPQGGSTVTRGGADGTSVRQYKIQMPVILAAINTPSDSVFLSRILIISTVKDQGRKPPDQHIFEHFTEEEYLRLQQNNTICLLPRIPEIYRRRNILRKRLPEIAGDLHRSTRFMESVLTPLAVYEMLGYDADAMYIDFLTKYKDRLAAISMSNNTIPVIDACLVPDKLFVHGEDGAISKVSAKTLLEEGEIHILNNLRTGVYFVSELQVIVLVWRYLVHSSLMQGNYEYIRKPVVALRDMAARCCHSWDSVTPEQHQLIVQSLGLHDVQTPMDYTVVDIAYLGLPSIGMKPIPPKQIAEPSGVIEESAAATDLSYVEDFDI